MKRLLLSTSIAVLVLSSATAFADSNQGKRGNQGKQAKHLVSRDDDRRDARRDHDRDDQRDGHGDRHEARHDSHLDNGRHLGWQKQAFRRGQRLPAQYMQQRYYVQDYRAYRLAPPPSGYRWVRPDNNRYLLIQTATGLISQMLGY